jgi:D-3-phosphoglycerate dehydrogenase
MLNMVDRFRAIFTESDIELVTPEVTQTLTPEQLSAILPNCDGWIAGDDPASRQVLTAGRNGLLKSVVKWGVGTDNVDIEACKELGIHFSNTPDVFGKEVADVAVGYCISLARQLPQIDRAVRAGNWLKIRGSSLANKNAAIVGFGSVGIELATRIKALDMNMDYLFLVCPLTTTTHHLLNESIFRATKQSLQIINVSRGQLIDEVALIGALENSLVGGIAMDVFETEPPVTNSSLLQMEHCIFGSHNSSNTEEAVKRASYAAIEIILSSLGKN